MQLYPKVQPGPKVQLYLKVQPGPKVQLYLKVQLGPKVQPGPKKQRLTCLFKLRSTEHPLFVGVRNLTLLIVKLYRVPFGAI